MAREYAVEEKLAYVEEYENSGMSISEFTREKRIPSTTFRGWLRLNRAMAFGELNFNQTTNITKSTSTTIIPSSRRIITFASNDIKIELKEGFNKEFLKKIVEVLIYDK